MRVRSLSATALAAAALIHPSGVYGQVPSSDVDIKAANVVRAAATSAGALTSAETTYRVTLTVMRVVQTVTPDATASTQSVPTTLTSATTSSTSSELGNETTLSSMSTNSSLPSGAASRVGLDTVSWAAILGLAGLLAV